MKILVAAHAFHPQLWPETDVRETVCRLFQRILAVRDLV